MTNTTRTRKLVLIAMLAAISFHFDDFPAIPANSGCGLSQS
jgi:riboflavin transporter FmnP